MSDTYQLQKALAEQRRRVAHEDARREHGQAVSIFCLQLEIQKMMAEQWRIVTLQRVEVEV